MSSGTEVAAGRSVDVEKIYAAKRLVLGMLLAWVLWSLAGNLVGFTSLIVNSSRESHAIVGAQRWTRSAEIVESKLKETNAFGLVAQAGTTLHCVTSTARWNFECSFMPTPRTSTTRVQFGVNVDANLSMSEVSTLSPVGTALPSPKHPLLVR